MSGNSSKKIVVLGAGYAGILIAKKLEKKARKQGIQNLEITIIDKNPFHTMLTELHEVAAWRVDEESIRIDLKKIFAGRKVNVVMDEIVETDYEGRQIKGKLANYSYDFLVMASGCKSTYFGVTGAQDHSFPLWSYDEAVRLRHHIMDMFRQASVERDPLRKKALLTFYIIGAGFTGVEMAGELAEFAPIACEKFGLNKKDVSIYNLDFADKIMAFLPDKARNRAMKRLKKMGVDVMLKTSVVGVNPDSVEYTQGGKNTKDPTFTVIWAAGTEASDIALKSEDLGHAPKTRGRIQTDKFLRSLTHPNVYVGGDNIFYIPEGEKDPVPQMVENCETCAPVIAENILAQLQGAAPTAEYKPKFHGAMVCIGGKYGTAYGGLPGKFFVQPSFFAMAAKHFINIVYFFQILGFNKVMSYIKHEFFTIRNTRSFLGGHLSNRGPLFMIFPLRLFMGIYFIYQAYYKYASLAIDWLHTPRLYDRFADIAQQVRPVFSIPFTNISMDFGFFGIIRYSVFYTDNVTHMWLQTSPMSWFLETFVIHTPGAELFWQRFIVVFCLILGLMFFAGLFTTPAAILALIYAGIILLTTGIPFYSWWLFFAPFALMFIGGRVLSLDYYFMPWLKKQWKKIGWVRRLYLYKD